MERTIFFEFGTPIAIGLVILWAVWIIMRHWPRPRDLPVTLKRYVHDANGKEIGCYTVSCRTVGEALDADHRIRINTDYLSTLRASATELEAETTTSLREQLVANRRNAEAVREGLPPRRER